jgi:hypothetical protein
MRRDDGAFARCEFLRRRAHRRTGEWSPADKIPAYVWFRMIIL